MVLVREIPVNALCVIFVSIRWLRAGGIGEIVMK